jgi:hypothetical protein
LHSSNVRTEQSQNLESRAENACWIRTLTFTLSLAGRGETYGRRPSE